MTLFELRHPVTVETAKRPTSKNTQTNSRGTRTRPHQNSSSWHTSLPQIEAHLGILQTEIVLTILRLRPEANPAHPQLGVPAPYRLLHLCPLLDVGWPLRNGPQHFPRVRLLNRCSNRRTTWHVARLLTTVVEFSDSSSFAAASCFAVASCC